MLNNNIDIDTDRLLAAGDGIADTIKKGLDDIQQEAQLPDKFKSIPETVDLIFSTVIVFSGVVFMLMLLFGGVTYLVSAGNEEGTARAKKIMINAMIGLVITLAAWAVGKFILITLGFVVP